MRERRRRHGIGWVRMWRGSRRSKGRGKHNQNMLYEFFQ